jgi:type III pantothenate kinase
MSLLEPVDGLLAIDVGNTRIGLAVSDSDGLHDVLRVATAEPNTWPKALDQVWSAFRPGGRRAVVIGSVAPQAARALTTLVQERCDLSPLRVHEDLPLPMPLRIDNPHEVGVDRICAAAAAYDRTRGTCTVASFGTAITIDCVSPDGYFLGGAILPGLEMSCDALHEHTAQLPRVKPTRPGAPFGRNTHDAIVNGVVYAAVGALREIVERFATELREWPQLVITGGDAALIRPLADFVDAVVPDLCLMGIALAYCQAAGRTPGRASSSFRANEATEEPG